MKKNYYCNNTSKIHLLVSLEEEISKKKQIKILDIGCGNCNYWKVFLNKNKQVQFYGIDINVQAIFNAKKSLPIFKENIILLNARNMEKLKKIEFDYITSNSALEHIYKREDFFNMLSNISSKNTKIIINWDFGHFRTGDFKIYFLNKLSVFLAFIGIEKYYTNEFKVEIFKKIISLKGFKIIDEKYFNLLNIKGLSKNFFEINKDWYEFELRLNKFKNKKILNEYLASAYFILKKK